MGCNCGKTKGVQAYVVKRPGKPDKIVTSETAANELTKGIPGAMYRPIKRS